MLQKFVGFRCHIARRPLLTEHGLLFTAENHGQGCQSSEERNLSGQSPAYPFCALVMGSRI